MKIKAIFFGATPLLSCISHAYDTPFSRKSTRNSNVYWTCIPISAYMSEKYFQPMIISVYFCICLYVRLYQKGRQYFLFSHNNVKVRFVVHCLFIQKSTTLASFIQQGPRICAVWLRINTIESQFFRILIIFLYYKRIVWLYVIEMTCVLLYHMNGCTTRIKPALKCRVNELDEWRLMYSSSLVVSFRSVLSNGGTLICVDDLNIEKGCHLYWFSKATQKVAYTSSQQKKNL